MVTPKSFDDPNKVFALARAYSKILKESVFGKEPEAPVERDSSEENDNDSKQ
jgi:hypothetical protein